MRTRARLSARAGACVDDANAWEHSLARLCALKPSPSAPHRAFILARAVQSKKPVSAAEKRVRMLEIFHEVPVSPYQLKDLERIAPKTKGVIVQAVKDVVMELVYDNLVTQEKLGTSQYFWSFPAAVAHKKRAKLAELEKEEKTCIEYAAKQSALLAEAESKLAVPPSAPEYQARLKQLECARAKRAKLEESVRAENEDDASALRRMAADMQTMKEGVNRWTDNISIAKSHFVNKCNMDKATFDRWMGIRGGSFFESMD